MIDALHQCRRVRPRAATTTPGASSGRCSSSSSRDWQRARRGDLGGARAAAPLHPLEGHGLGRLRPRGQGRRAVRPATGRSSAGEAPRDDDPRARSAARGTTPSRGRLRPVLRLEAPRREPADDPAGRLPAGRRPARAGHGRGDRARPHAPTASSRATTRDPDVDGLPPGEGAFLPCTFWLADNLALPGPPRRGRARCSSGCSRSATTSGCCPRSTTPTRAGCSATSPRRYPHLPRQHRPEPGPPGRAGGAPRRQARRLTKARHRGPRSPAGPCGPRPAIDPPGRHEVNVRRGIARRPRSDALT